MIKYSQVRDGKSLKNLNFISFARLRDEIIELKERLKSN